MNKHIQSYLEQLSKLSKDFNLFKPTKSSQKQSIDDIVATCKDLYEETTGSPLLSNATPTQVLGSLKSIVTVGALPHDDDIFWHTVGKPGSANYNLRQEILSAITDLQEALSRSSLVKNIKTNLDNQEQKEGLE